jgi:hypothetical protein
MFSEALLLAALRHVEIEIAAHAANASSIVSRGGRTPTY